jgi:hypothetical protein
MIAALITAFISGLAIGSGLTSIYISSRGKR